MSRHDERPGNGDSILGPGPHKNATFTFCLTFLRRTAPHILHFKLPARKRPKLSGGIIHLLLVPQIGYPWSCTITEKAPTRAFSWLKAPTSAFTIKTLLRHYTKWALTPRSLNVKLGPRRNYHKGQVAIRHYANQTARPLWLLRLHPNFMLRDRGVNAHLV